MRELRDAINAARSGPPNLRISLHHVVNSFADPLLYLFHLQAIDPEGNPEDPFETGEASHIALVANQPVEVQIETTLAFLGQLIERQRHVVRVREGNRGVGDIDIRTAAADEAGEVEVVDRLRYGWRTTAEMTGAKAEEAGFALSVEYTPAFLTTAEESRRRLPLLRRVYNEMEDVRALCDRIVGAIAGRESRISGGAEKFRLLLQQRTTVSEAMRYFAQATRDALVLGNGYVRFTDTEPLGAYNLRPEATEPLGGGRVLDLRTGEELGEGVLHFTGFEQPGTPIGFGVCELFVTSLREQDVVRRAIRDMERFIDTEPEAARAVAEYTALAERQEESRQSRVAALLGWWEKNVPSPSENLYFEGQINL